jgi:hypothetical protein
MKMRFSDITPVDWEILDALSDDYESIEQIQSLISDDRGEGPTQSQILDRLTYLHEKNYIFLTLGQIFSREGLQDEIDGRTKDRKYWFGRTESGYLAWLEHDPDNKEK